MIDPDVDAMEESMDRPRRARRMERGQPPELKGIPLLVGLAIGSPEFQRR